MYHYFHDVLDDPEHLRSVCEYRHRRSVYNYFVRPETHASKSSESLRSVRIRLTTSRPSASWTRSSSKRDLRILRTLQAISRLRFSIEIPQILWVIPRLRNSNAACG